MQNYNKKSDFARIIAKKSVSLQSEIKISETMTQEQEKQLGQLMKNVDIIDILKIALVSSTKYNRRILKFFRWFCKWVPVFIMCAHALSVLMDNMSLFIYAMVYVLPMIIIIASRFFFLCWRYRIPFMYCFGLNAIHIVHCSVFTTAEMIMSHYALFVMIAVIYVYAFSDILLNTCFGRRLFK